jgi:hypothetical protein
VTSGFGDFSVGQHQQVSRCATNNHKPMFQLKRWNKGVVHREGAALQISVSRPGGGDEVLLALIALFMAYGFFKLFFVPMPRIASPRDFLQRIVPTLVFGLPFIFIFRRLFEQKCGAQIVTVNAERICWTRKTRLWKRTRHLTSSEVTEIASSTNFLGFGKVYVTSKWRRHVVLEELLAEDAVRFARELNQAVGVRH